MKTTVPVGDTAGDEAVAEPWRDPSRPVAERVADLLTPDDAGREARPARQRVDRGLRRRRRWGSGAGAHAARVQRRAAAGGGPVPGWHGPADPGVRHPPGTARGGNAGPGRAAAADRGREQVRHPGDRARGVPHRLRRLEGDDLPGPAGLGSVLRPGPGTPDGGRHRDRHAGQRRAPGPGAGGGRDPGPALGPHRGDHRRGPLPGRHDRHGLRAGPAVGRGGRDAEALRRLLGVPRRAEHGPGVHGPARVRRRDPAAVRDGDPRWAAPAR